MVKRIMAMFLAAVMLLSTKSTVLASELQNDNNVEGIGQESVESVIEEYISAVDEQDYGKVVGLSHPGVREIMASVYSNEVNRENNVGLFNIRNIMLKNTMLSMEEALGLYYDHEYLSNFDSYEIALLSTEVEVNEEQDALINGEAYFCAIIVEDEGEIYVLDMVVVDTELGAFLSGDVQARGVSTPTGTNILIMPTTIKVYRAHAYSGESSSVRGTIQTVNFETYCKIVTHGEFRGASQMEALKAQAVAVRNAAFHRYLYRNSISSGFHVIDSGSDDGGTGYYLDQYYNPTFTPNANVVSAVNSTRNYVVLDASNRLIPTFYRAGTASAEGQNGGLFKQNGADYLASTRGYNCAQLIHYYYDRVSGVSYYNNEVAVGAVSLHTHTNTYTVKNALQHFVDCSGCGNTQTANHSWGSTVETGGNGCVYCGYTR